MRSSFGLTRCATAAALTCAAMALASCGHGMQAGASASPSPTLPVTTGDYPAFGYAPDFSWIAGRLLRSAPAGLCTYVVFSSHPGAPWGGRIALANAASSAAFPDGAMVVVEGEIDADALGTCGEPALVVRTIAEH